MQNKTPHYIGMISIQHNTCPPDFPLTNAIKSSPSLAAKELLSYKTFPLFTQPKEHYHASGPYSKSDESSQGPPVLFHMIHFNIILPCIHQHLLRVLFFSGLLAKILYAFLVSCTPCLLHPPLFHHSKVC
jgi:hypothetical protein